jgi:deoxycytidine triphosphate deaminase
MARILPDKEIRPLLERVIIGASPDCVRHNSYELRLGGEVKFDSTGEQEEIPEGYFLEIQPGDFVTISSWEKLDFRRETFAALGKKTNLMGLITPTTTMMREGFLFTTTKVDPGFRGDLNWGIRNSSVKAVRLKRGERLFKLTLYELQEDEVPERLYGEQERDSYQNAEGITPSARMIPADIPESRIVRRSERKIDPTKELLEAGHPFSHIGTELISLHGKFEIVSKDVLLLREQFEQRTSELSSKIETETQTLSGKLEDSRKNILEKVEALFDRKFLRIAGVIIGAVPVMYGGVMFLQGTGFGGKPLAFVAVSVGAVILLLTYLLSRKA